MKKSKKLIKNFLATVWPATEKDECLVRLYFNKSKVGLCPPVPFPGSEKLERVNYDQVK